jgi:hypothetical protein
MLETSFVMESTGKLEDLRRVPGVMDVRRRAGRVHVRHDRYVTIDTIARALDAVTGRRPESRAD